jgi:TetR/AcrR family transcriptional repressor of nem operon
MKFEKNEAVGKALEVFWNSSYAATTPQELVEGLGIGKGSLYNTFSSKRGLYDLTLAEYVRRRAEVLEATLRRPGSRIDALAAGIAVLVGLDMANPKGCFIVNAVAEHGEGDTVVADASANLFELIKRTFGTCLEAAVQEGEARSDLDVDQKASELLAIVIGSSILLRTGGDKSAVEGLVDGVLRELRSGEKASRS